MPIAETKRRHGPKSRHRQAHSARHGLDSDRRSSLLSKTHNNTKIALPLPENARVSDTSRLRPVAVAPEWQGSQSPPKMEAEIVSPECASKYAYLCEKIPFGAAQGHPAGKAEPEENNWRLYASGPSDSPCRGVIRADHTNPHKPENDLWATVLKRPPDTSAGNVVHIIPARHQTYIKNHRSAVEDK